MAMTEKEAIRLINAYLEIDYSRIPEMTVEKFDEAMTMMMESFEKNQWIPVTERLPEEGPDILVCDIDGDIEVAHLSRLFRTEFFSSYGDKIKNVKAWMPLPEPWKGEEG